MTDEADRSVVLALLQVACFAIEPTDTYVIAVLSEATLTHTRKLPVSILTHGESCVRTVIQVVRGTLIYIVATGTAFPACLAAARAVNVVT